MKKFVFLLLVFVSVYCQSQYIELTLDLNPDYWADAEMVLDFEKNRFIITYAFENYHDFMAVTVGCGGRIIEDGRIFKKNVGSGFWLNILPDDIDIGFRAGEANDDLAVLLYSKEMWYFNDDFRGVLYQRFCRNVRGYYYENRLGLSYILFDNNDYGKQHSWTKDRVGGSIVFTSGLVLLGAFAIQQPIAVDGDLNIREGLMIGAGCGALTGFLIQNSAKRKRVKVGMKANNVYLRCNF
jgi:hypothetical protein